VAYAATICPYLVGARADYRNVTEKTAKRLASADLVVHDREDMPSGRPAHMYLLWTRSYRSVQVPDGSLGIRAGDWDREQEIGCQVITNAE